MSWGFVGAGLEAWKGGGPLARRKVLGRFPLVGWNETDARSASSARKGRDGGPGLPPTGNVHLAPDPEADNGIPASLGYCEHGSLGPSLVTDFPSTSCPGSSRRQQREECSGLGGNSPPQWSPRGLWNKSEIRTRAVEGCSGSLRGEDVWGWSPRVQICQNCWILQLQLQ